MCKKLVCFVVLALVNLSAFTLGQIPEPPDRVDPCFIVTTKPCANPTIVILNEILGEYCETSPCDRHQTVTTDFQGHQVTTVWWTCPKSDGDYESDDTYQGITNIYGDDIGKTEFEPTGVEIVCAQRFHCKSSCDGPGNCKKGFVVTDLRDENGNWIHQRWEWKVKDKRLKGTTCRGPENPPLPPTQEEIDELLGGG